MKAKQIIKGILGLGVVSGVAYLAYILNDIANCTIDVEKILHITRRRRKAC